jgi:hypothetical protein
LTSKASGYSTLAQSKATTAEDAINEVAKLFRIEPMLRDKLVAIKCPEPLGGGG